MVGDYIVDPLPPIEFGRIAAQAAKQVIFQKVRDAERERQYEEFKDRAGEIITGVVKRVEFGHVVVDLGRAEGVIRRDQQIPREILRVGDRIRSLIMSVRRENEGPQIFLSRAHPDFMKKLFAQEVPEIYDGIIEIKAAARDPGSRAKIGVISHDSSIDPVGACVGMKGSRVQAVVQELQGEKIDIIPWCRGSRDLRRQRPPAGDRQPRRHRRGGEPDRGRRSRRPAFARDRPPRPECPPCQPADVAIDILTEADACEKRQREFVERSELFQTELDVDETLAQLLVAEGFAALEEVAYVELDDSPRSRASTTTSPAELQNRAQEALERREAARARSAARWACPTSSPKCPISPSDAGDPGQGGDQTLDDLADLATDELVQKKRPEQRRQREPNRSEDKGGVLADYGLSDEQGNEIIMAARAHWFEDEAKA